MLISWALRCIEYADTAACGISRAADLGSRFGAFREVADEHGVSPQQVCLAWMVTRSPVVIPIPGSSRPETIRDSAAAPDLRLSNDEVSRLDEGWPPA